MVKQIREIIKHVPLPARTKEAEKQRKAIVKRKNSAGVEEQFEITSDFECEKPAEATAWPKGWCDTPQEREVSNYIKNVIDAAIIGPAKEVVMNMGMSRDRTGFETVERLAEVYGRNAAHIVMMPYNFVWGKNSLIEDWSNYKHKIENTKLRKNHQQKVRDITSGFCYYFVRLLKT